MYTQHRPAQSEIFLAGLQSVAQRSVHQESFVRVSSVRHGIILWRCSRDLIQFVFRGGRSGAEPALLLLGTLRDLSGLSLPERLQLQRPLGGLLTLREPWADLDLLTSVLEPKHLDFHRTGSRG